MADGTRRRGTTLVEALVALAILGIVVLFGTTFFVKRREVERERQDRDVALRALRSEWAYLRTQGVSEGTAMPFVGSELFLEQVAARDPKLTAVPETTPGLYRVTLEIGYGVKRQGRRVRQEGFVYAHGGAP